MAYLWSLVAVAAALVLLVVLALVVLGPVRRLTTVLGALRAELDREGGMITARLAALRVRWAEHRA